MTTSAEFPTVLSVVLDTTDARELAEFYRRLLGWSYRPGDQTPPAGQPDANGAEWLVLNGPGIRLAFQQVTELARATWPEPAVPQQLHLDLTVPDVQRLQRQHDRALKLGATELLDRTDDADEPLWVFADPQGHPFCIFVG